MLAGAARRSFRVMSALLSAALLSGCATPEATPLNGIQFVAVSGSGTAGQLAWLTTDRVTWWVGTRDNRRVVRVGTPCAGFEAGVEVTDEQMTIDRSTMQIAAVACDSPQHEYDAWIHNFAELPISYTLDGTTLTLSNDRGSLVLEPVTGD